MKTEPNESAFMGAYSGGLTKREYFAAMALQGLLAQNGSYDVSSVQAVIEADALIEELNKERK